MAKSTHSVIGILKITELIQEFRKNTEDSLKPSPETSKQVKMLLSWMMGE